MTPTASCEPRAFAASPQDNVATLLDAVRAGTRARLLVEGKCSRSVPVSEDIAAAHKVALARIPSGAPVVKYGHCIGRATREISPGEWVHLHNCASNVDERSNSLDVRSGAPQDTREAYG